MEILSIGRALGTMDMSSGRPLDTINMSSGRPLGTMDMSNGQLLDIALVVNMSTHFQWAQWTHYVHYLSIVSILLGPMDTTTKRCLVIRVISVIWHDGHSGPY